MAGIFKNNDIRGEYGTELSDKIAHKIGYAFGKHIGEGKKVVIGGDTRSSTPKLKLQIIDGLRKAGVNVYDLGVGPTPMIYYTACVQEVDEGIIITGSHNPVSQNGIKICDDRGASYDYDNLFGLLENQIGDLSVPGSVDEKLMGELHDANDMKEEYFNFLADAVPEEGKLKIAVDCGEGATFRFPKIIEEKGHNVISLGTDSQTGFKGKPPDPTKKESFERLIDAISDENCDIAIAFDADGDRVGFLSPTGNIILPDNVIMLYADSLLKKQEDVKIIIDVKISKATSEFIESKGGEVIICRVGHSYIHEKLLDTNATMAAELSGHFYFNDDYHGFDDGLYAAIRFIRIVNQIKKDGLDLDEVIDSLPKYSSTKEFRDHISFAAQDKIITELEQYGRENDAKIIKIDGIRAEFPRGWYIARKSGTEEVLSYRIEGETKEIRDELLDVVKSIIKKHRNQ